MTTCELRFTRQEIPFRFLPFCFSCSSSLPLQLHRVRTLPLISLQGCWITALASKVDPGSPAICVWVTEPVETTQRYCLAFAAASQSPRMLQGRLKISVQHQPTLWSTDAAKHWFIILVGACLGPWDDNIALKISLNLFSVFKALLFTHCFQISFYIAS